MKKRKLQKMLISTTFPVVSAKHYICCSCHLKLQISTFVPCYFNNLSNYDVHFIVTELGYDEQTILITPNSKEKLISFSNYINSNFWNNMSIYGIEFVYICFKPHRPNLKYFRRTAKVFSTSTRDAEGDFLQRVYG